MRRAPCSALRRRTTRRPRQCHRARFRPPISDFLRPLPACLRGAERWISIGFEVKDLEAFCTQLEAKGVKLSVPYRKQDGVGTAYLTDPKGTYIQLTEGLGKL